MTCVKENRSMCKLIVEKKEKQANEFYSHAQKITEVLVFMPMRETNILI